MVDVQYQFRTTSRKCKQCGNEFQSLSSKNIYCGKDCYSAAKEVKNKEYYKRKIQREMKVIDATSAATDHSASKPARVKKKSKRYAKAVRPTCSTKKRKCLRCNAEFLSEWNGNRVCIPCSAKNANEAGPREYRVVTEKKSSGTDY